MFKRFFAIAVAALALFCGSQALAPNNTQAHEVLVYGDDNTMHYLETETVRKAGGSYYAWIKIAIKNKSFENARFRFTPELDEKGYKHSKGAIQMPYGKVDLELLGRIAAWCGRHNGV